MKVVCEHCGLPFSVSRVAPGRPVYCCSGCALAARVPVDADGQFPVNAALASALGVGFAFFNQALFWLLSVLLAREADGAANAARFLWASHALGAGVWLALAVAQTRAGARRAVDRAVLAAGFALLAWGVVEGRPAVATGANVMFIGWALRGLRRKKN